MEQKLTIQLKEKSYPIIIGNNILNQLGKLIRDYLPNVQKSFLITNTTVDSLYSAQVIDSLTAAGLHSAKGIIPDGEIYKNLEAASGLYDQLLEHGIDRSSVVISLGGGVVGDLAGFVAATYMRGIKFIQVPTTLLAQVDSSVGGKVAVNHLRGKNLIGAFYQPQLVLIDIATLSTLPQEELVSGLAETIKHGVILDAEYFNWIELNWEVILRYDREALLELVFGSCRIKGQIVEVDECEQNLRAILNFGHTVGHALEAVTNYQRYRHGEAVSIGMIQVCKLAEHLGMIDSHITARLAELLQRVGLPIEVPDDISASALLEVIKRDKKSFQGRVKLILPESIGKVKQVETWHERDLLMVLQS